MLISSIEQLKFGYFCIAETNDLIIKTKGVIFLFSPVILSTSEDLNCSSSVTSASSWCVTWGIFFHELTRWPAAIFFILGMSFISTSPKSE